MSAPLRIEVRGNGPEAVLCARYLARLLPASRAVVGWRRTEGAPDLSGWSVLPDAIRAVHRFTKISERELLQVTDASFTLGYAMQGFGPSDYLNPFTVYGASVLGQSFHHVMLANGKTDIGHWGDYCLPAVMVDQGRFAPPQKKGPPLLSGYGYGYHVDAAAYLTFISRGAPGPLADDPDIIIETDSPDNYGVPSAVSALNLGASHETSRGEPALSSRTLADPKGVTVSAARRGAVDGLRLTVDDGGLRLGRVRDGWTEHTLRIGPAAGALPPVMGLPVWLFCAQLDCLATLIPASSDMAIEATEYSRLSARLYDRFDDFAGLQFAGAPQPWADRVTLSPDAQHKRDLFSARGRVATLDDDDRLGDHYVTMLLGSGLVPKRVATGAAALPSGKTSEFLAQLSGTIANIVPQMPTQAELLGRLGISAQTEAMPRAS